MLDYKLYPGRKLEKIEFENINYEEPEVTIITPYYNGHKYIDETAKSVLNQTFPNFEWLIIDDGSTNEESLKKLEEIEKMDKRIKVFHKKNGGVSETRDFGVEKANESSEYLLFLDADDLINKTFIECAYWTLKTNEKASWAYSDVVNFDGQEFLWVKRYDTDIQKKDNLLVVTALIRKKDFLRVNGFEIRDKNVYEDWYLWLKMMKLKMCPVRMNFLGFWYRKKPLEESELLQSNSSNRERAMSYINKIVKDIKETEEGIQYPKQDYNWAILKDDINIDKTKVKKDGKIKILMIIPWTVVGGADKFNLDLIKRIDKEKFEIIIITTDPSINPWRQQFEEYAIVYDLTTFLNRKYWPAFINYIIEKNNIDIIFNTDSTYGYATLPYLKAKYPEIPIVDYIHMEEWYNRNGGFSRDSSTVSSVIDKTLVCNGNSKRILEDYFKRKENEIETVYIGVDEQKFNPEKYNREEILKKYNINNKDKYIIGFIARIDLQKRPHLLMQIIKKLRQERNDFIFVIAGDGPMLSDIKSEAKRFGIYSDIVFLGNLKDTHELYKMSDLTLNCSIKEGLALTSYESLSMGVPVVSADVGGQKELIDDSVGVIVPCIQDETEISNFKYSEEEIQNYVDGVNKVLSDLQKYKDSCRKRILNGFTINHMVENMSNIFLELKNEPNKDKIQMGYNLQKCKDITLELITKYFISFKAEYRWLCGEFNKYYFGCTYDTGDDSEGYDYFKTFKGRTRLLFIRITKKMHIYDFIKKILKKVRNI